MIHNLLTKITQLLPTELAGLITQPADHILALPIAEPKPESLPLISIYPGYLQINQNFKHSSSSQPSLQELSQEIIVYPAQPTITYQLAQTPVKGSTLCHLVVDEQASLLQEDADFDIDYQQGTITLKKQLRQASKIRLNYSFLAIFVIREFTQYFFVDIWENNLAKIDKLASLTSAIILTNHDELVKYFNLHPANQYQTNQIITTHSISQIHFLKGSYHTLANPVKFQFKFQVMGQLKFGKTVKDNLLPIQKIQISQNLNS